MFHNLKEGIRCVVFQPIDCRSRIEKSDAFLVKESSDFVLFEAFMHCINEIILITKPNLSFDASVVVDEVGVEKVHAPALLRRRETAEEQDLCI